MNQKLAFLLPRAAGITLLAGVAAVVLFLVFKLLLLGFAAAVIFMAAKGIMSFFRKNDSQSSFQGHHPVISLDGQPSAGYRPVRDHAVIIPIS